LRQGVQNTVVSSLRIAQLEQGRVGGCGCGRLLPGRHGGPSLIVEKDAHGPRNRHSDKEKFRSDLNRPKSCEMSERFLKTLRKSGDFQAEYEGSISFTRSKSDFNDLAQIFKLPF
jgi:hypothetical protein